MTLSAGTVMKLKSWIPLQIGWQEFPHSQVVTVPAQDHGLIEFLVKGSCVVHTGGSRELALLLASMIGLESLTGQLQRYVATAVTPLVTARRKSLPKELTVHCWGAWRLPGDNSLALLISLDEPVAAPFPLGIELARHLQDLLDQHERLVTDWKAEKAARDALHRDQCDANPEYKEALEKARIFSSAEDESRRPKVALGATASLFPCATLLDGSLPRGLLRGTSALQRKATQAIAASGFLPSRDGQYSGIVAGNNATRRGIVTWSPHVGLPSYPEVRWAVQTLLPRAMARPRSSHLGRPKVEIASGPADVAASVLLPGDTGDWAEVLGELAIDDTDFAKRIGQSRQERSTDGFEAIAWFQPYHEWTEETWGIYLDAQRLDDFALSIWADCRDWRCPISFGLASILAVGLIQAHEMFHARVEAASSWLELNARSAGYRRYQADVYRALSGTSEWLEEALANWSSWDWFNSPKVQALLSARGENHDKLPSIIEGVLDLSPPGYQDWRAGRDRETWRQFASQLASGKPDPGRKSIALPLESIFRDPLPYDLLASDIPTWIVGNGKIAQQLGSHPASFHVPSRREAEKVLRHFNHRHEPARGKGSHEQWVAPDERAFPLPARDPLSQGVFRNLLSHLGIDKKTYVRDIRPKL